MERKTGLFFAVGCQLRRVGGGIQVRDRYYKQAGKRAEVEERVKEWWGRYLRALKVSPVRYCVNYKGKNDNWTVGRPGQPHLNQESAWRPPVMRQNDVMQLIWCIKMTTAPLLWYSCQRHLVFGSKQEDIGQVQKGILQNTFKVSSWRRQKNRTATHWRSVVF